MRRRAGEAADDNPEYRVSAALGEASPWNGGDKRWTRMAGARKPWY